MRLNKDNKMVTTAREELGVNTFSVNMESGNDEMFEVDNADGIYVKVYSVIDGNLVTRFITPTYETAEKFMDDLDDYESCYIEETLIPISNAERIEIVNGIVKK